MAWIKMRTDLARDPAVIQLADKFDLDETMIVGLLHKIWSWADEQVTEGNASSVTKSFLDRYTKVEGFADGMIEVGWLTEKRGGISFPNWEKHMGKSAKTRAMTALRASKSRNAPSVTSALRNAHLDKSKSKSKSKSNTSSSSSGDSTHNTETMTTTDDAWIEVDQELARSGVALATETSKKARENGWSVAGAMNTLAYWRDSTTLDPTDLVQRLTRGHPDTPIDQGWRTPAEVEPSPPTKDREEWSFVASRIWKEGREKGYSDDQILEAEEAIRKVKGYSELCRNQTWIDKHTKPSPENDDG